MTSLYSGRPYNVEANLPSAVNISSTTNATPIVIATASAHNLKTGDYFIVIGAQDPGLAGPPPIFKAGTVTSTTVVALTVAGANTVGTLLGGAQGTVQSAGFGVTVPILSGGDSPSASLWNVPYEAVLDRTAWLEYFVNFGRKRRRPRVILGSGNHTIDTSQGDCFQLPTSPTGPANIKLRTSTNPLPRENERIEIVCPGLDSTAAGGGSQILYQIMREDTTIIASFYGIDVPQAVISLECEFSNGVWRAGQNSGFAPAAPVYGVLIGAGA